MTSKANLTITCLAMLLAICSAPVASAPNDGERHGAWQIACTNDGQCALEQRIVRQSDSVEALHIQALKTLPSGPVLILSTPWGVQLQDGVSLSIDNGGSTVHQYEFCDPSGCHLAIALDQLLISTMQAGSFAHVGFSDSMRNPVTINISLNGFTTGYQAL